MIEDLKLCPFCGGEGTLSVWKEDGFGDGNIECWFIGCENKHCFGSQRSNHGTKDETIKAWNTRA